VFVDELGMGVGCVGGGCWLCLKMCWGCVGGGVCIGCVLLGWVDDGLCNV